jgi:hypothetical protein
MTYFDAYIGDWNGNTPASLGPDFPPTRTGRGYPGNVFAETVARVDEGTLDGKQTDRVARVARADKATSRAFVDELCSENESYSEGSGVPRLVESLGKFRDFVEQPDEGKKYALVASET